MSKLKAHVHKKGCDDLIEMIFSENYIYTKTFPSHYPVMIRMHPSVSPDGLRLPLSIT